MWEASTGPMDFEMCSQKRSYSSLAAKWLEWERQLCRLLRQRATTWPKDAPDCVKAIWNAQDTWEACTWLMFSETYSQKRSYSTLAARWLERERQLCHLSCQRATTCSEVAPRCVEAIQSTQGMWEATPRLIYNQKYVSSQRTVQWQSSAKVKFLNFNPNML